MNAFIKVVPADEMARVESQSFQEGLNEEALMLEAGKSVALAALSYIQAKQIQPKILLLAGKGNNGADAYVAGTYLLQKKVQVSALHVNSIQRSSILCQKYAAEFQKNRGKIREIEKEEDIDFLDSKLLIDGLLGTGFHGKVEGMLKILIERANHSNLPIISIDIPSGVNGNNGEVLTSAIDAVETISFSLPKTGLFVQDGWNHVGHITIKDIGLPSKYYDRIKEDFYWIQKIGKNKLPSIKRSRHKYEVGSISAISGSKGMEGAAKLACLSALRSGAGIVSLYLPKDMEAEMATFPKEIVKNFWDAENIENLKNACNRSSAVMIGPGIGRSKQVEKMLLSFLPQIEVPTILDADGLFFLSQHPDCSLPSQTILTPHHNEMRRILADNSISDMELIRACKEYCKKKKVVLILKGGPSFVFSYDRAAVVITRGDPGMATAGSGDVLTGIVSAFVAQGLELWDAATLGVYLHGIAGEKAAEEKTSYGLIASDLIEKLPDAIKELD